MFLCTSKRLQIELVNRKSLKRSFSDNFVRLSGQKKLLASLIEIETL